MSAPFTTALSELLARFHKSCEGIIDDSSPDYLNCKDLQILFVRLVEQDKQERIVKNKSYCGCPMCLHHTEPYEAKNE